MFETEWHLYAKFGENHQILQFPSWEMVRNQISVLAQKHMPKHQAMVERIAQDATPNRPLALTSGEDVMVKLRPIRKHPPMDAVSQGQAREPGYEGEHADLGASSCYRWWECPGSINLIQQVKRERPELIRSSSIYAQLGTAAHQLAHDCLVQGQDAIEYIDRTIPLYDHHTGEIYAEVPVDDEMATAVQVYLDECRSHLKEGVLCRTETKFSLKPLNPPGPMFGTSDFSALDMRNSVLTIIDYKHGEGVVVEARENPQLKYYALGVLATLPEGHPMPARVITKIVQPRGHSSDPIKEAQYHTSEIMDWYVELFNRAEETIKPDAPLSAGSWCRFCAAQAACPAATKLAWEKAAEELPADIVASPPPPKEIKEQVKLLSLEKMAEMRLHFPFIRQVMKAVDEALLQSVQSGRNVPYWEAVQGEGKRRWIDEEDTCRALGEMGVPEDNIYKRELISPHKAEQLIVQDLRELGMSAKSAKDMARESLKSLTVRPPTAPALVLKGSKRPALPGPQDELEADYLEIE